MKVAGESFHIGGYELNPVRLQTADGFDIDDDASYTLFDLDYDVFGVHLEAHIHRVPSIESAGIASTVNGPESFTPDHRPLMGEAPDLRGFFFGCGLNSAGILYSGGFGRELASWVAPALNCMSVRSGQRSVYRVYASIATRAQLPLRWQRTGDGSGSAIGRQEEDSYCCERKSCVL